VRAPGLFRFARVTPYGDRGAGVRSRPGQKETGTAHHSFARTSRVCRVLGVEVVRYPAQRRKGFGSEGRAGFLRLDSPESRTEQAARSIRARIAVRPGQHLCESSGEF